MNAMMAMVSRAGGLAQICRIVEHMRLTMVLFVMYARIPLALVLLLVYKPSTNTLSRRK